MLGVTQAWSKRGHTVEVTDVRIKLSSGGQPRLLAYCTVTFDHCFVVRDVKVIEGNDGPFIAMPSRRPMERCMLCRTRNPSKAKFCSECGKPVEGSTGEGTDGRLPRHVDIAHPITREMRQELHNAVMGTYEDEKNRAASAGGEEGGRVFTGLGDVD